MHLSDIRKVQAEIDVNRRYLRLRELKKDPNRDNVGDFLVETIEVDPGRAPDAERLLKDLMDNKLSPSEAVEEIDTLYRKWKQIAKKELPKTQAKVAKAIRKLATGSKDVWLKKNRMKLSKKAADLMGTLIISLAATVWQYGEYESAMFFELHGDTEKLFGRIYLRQDNSLYRRYRYYVDALTREPLGPKDQAHQLLLNQPFSGAKQTHSIVV